MEAGESAVAVGGYQGERSVHTRALRALVGALDPGPLAGCVRLEIDVTQAGTTAQQLFDAVDGGSRQICYMASSYLTARVPALAVLDLPFSVADREAAYAALDGEAGRMLARDVERASGYRVLGFWDNGFRHLSNRLRPLRRPEDCRGLVIRTLDNQIYREVFAALGFTPRSIDVRDFKAAVASGAVDAQENPLTNLIGFGLEAHHRFVSLTGHFFGVALLVCHRPWLERLPGATRTALVEAARAATVLQRRWATEEDVTAGAFLRQRGVEVLGRDAIDLAGFEAACRAIREREAARLDPALVAAYLGATRA